MSAWLGDGAEDKAEREKAGERRDGASRHPRAGGTGCLGGGLCREREAEQRECSRVRGSMGR